MASESDVAKMRYELLQLKIDFQQVEINRLNKAMENLRLRLQELEQQRSVVPKFGGFGSFGGFGTTPVAGFGSGGFGTAPVGSAPTPSFTFGSTDPPAGLFGSSPGFAFTPLDGPK